MTAPDLPAQRRPSTRRSSATGADGATTTAGRRSAKARTVPPILVRQVRNGIEESVHRGDIVEADVDGRLIRGLGDPDRIVTLRSCVKPFGVAALIEAGGVEAFDLEPAEIAIMASSHSGEDLHVRTIQAMYRRAGASQALIATGIEGMPLDQLTAMRLARDGEQPGPIRHMCSGQHSVFILLSRLKGWNAADYWHDDHPAQVAYRSDRRPGVRDVARQALDRDRRLRRAHVRVPAPRGRPGLRDARRPLGRGRRATRGPRSRRR